MAGLLNFLHLAHIAARACCVGGDQAQLEGSTAMEVSAPLLLPAGAPNLPPAGLDLTQPVPTPAAPPELANKFKAALRGMLCMAL